MTGNKVAAVDFDGTIAAYKKWEGKGIFGSPLPGAKFALQVLKREGWTIIINTTRLELNLIELYLKANDIPFDYLNFNPDNNKYLLHPAKVIADVYVDDRAIPFRGNWDATYAEIKKFKEWWRE